ncbi:MAG: amino acid ABC transporter substrate-binding protein [Campylobacterota bacterium]|nr:amino acid ABC transporter substrate-binding protein [Campylobacterota bacterium]
MKKIVKLSIAALMATTVVASAGTLDNVKKAGMLNCGVNTGLPGFSEVGADRKWKGIDVDMCKAVAAAVLGDASKVKYVPLTSKERFAALQSGEIDMLVRNTTWTNTRDASLGLNFAGVNYYDGQGFLVAKSLGIKNASELDGATFCLMSGTTTELNLANYFKSNNMQYKSVIFDTPDQEQKAFAAGRCDVVTSDQSSLAATKSKMADPSKFELLPDVISKEPLGPVVRQGDDVWFNIVRWSLNALITAEEFGVTQGNVDDQLKNSKVPEVHNLLGKTGTLGKNLGLKADWSYQIIKQVGNYGESFEKHVGPKTPLQLQRGLNALWKDGGILYSPPFR